MRIFPHRLAQEDILGDVVREFIGRSDAGPWLYTEMVVGDDLVEHCDWKLKNMKVDAEYKGTPKGKMYRIPRNRAGDMYNADGKVYIPYQGSVRLEFKPLPNNDELLKLMSGSEWQKVE